jgi:hypothetical protein
MKKPYICYIVVPALYIADLRAFAVQYGDGGPAENKNFSMAFCLESDPNTIVAYGGSTGPISQAVVDYLETNVISNLPASALWVRCANETHPARVLKTNYKPSQNRIDAGEVILFDLESILTKIGMVIYSPAQ